MDYNADMNWSWSVGSGVYRFLCLFLAIGILVIASYKGLSRSASPPTGNHFVSDLQPTAGQPEVQFLFHGKPLDQTVPGHVDYFPAVEKFSTLQSCLADPKDTAGGSSLDWARIKSPEEADVCLFRMFSALGGASEIQAWLADQNFDVSPPWPVHIPASETSPPMKGLSIEASRLIGKNGVLFHRNILDLLSQKIFSQGVSLVLQIAADGSVVFVKTTINYE